MWLYDFTFTFQQIGIENICFFPLIDNCIYNSHIKSFVFHLLTTYKVF